MSASAKRKPNKIVILAKLALSLALTITGLFGIALSLSRPEWYYKIILFLGMEFSAGVIFVNCLVEAKQ